jgi:signal transduction histidine kinase/ActR/RegA family two-component response regulator
MDPAENAIEENRSLRRTMRDMVALSTLPAIWIGLGMDGIARSLAEVLLHTLSLDLIYVRLAGLDGEGVIEVVRSKHAMDAAQVDAVRAALAPVLLNDKSGDSITILDPLASGTLQIGVTRFGVSDDYGVLVTGCCRTDFPTERDRLLLGVGANQTAIVLQRRRAETALADARSRLEAALVAGAIATWTWDIPNNRLFADANLARLFNLPPSEAEGGLLDRYIQSIHPDDWPRVAAALERSVKSGEDYEADYRIVQADGSVRWVAARGRVERDGSGRPVRMPGVLVDITERKRLEDELRATDRRKDEFLATLAHELRNPLAPIRNSLQILKIPRVDSATVQQTRDMMERQVEQLVRLVDDLMDVSRVMQGKIELRKEPLELATVIARAVETVQPLIEVKGHRLETTVPSESLLLDADSVRLSQVIGNLLTNAAKYTEANGRIWLSVERSGCHAVLKVRDNGIGIDPVMLPHVFNLFVQVDHAATRSQGGLGIGLTLVKNLIEMHGGTVEAHSEGLGKGSEFVIWLPLLVVERREPHESENGCKPQDIDAAAGYRLMVVDDNQDAAVSLAMLLRLQGHEVRVVHDGPSALEQAQAFDPAMVFLDIGMPGMDGHEVARKIRQQPGLENVVLAALTGWGQKEDRRRTAEAGFDHHLVKPPEPEAVARLLAGLKHADQ